LRSESIEIRRLGIGKHRDRKTSGLESIGIRKPDVDLVDENQTAGLVHMSSSGNPAARQEQTARELERGGKP
jgi:hypothetical protein